MDKPAGPTSHDVVARVRRVLGTRAVGHAGTLDPFATGLLVVLVGRATRLARFVEREAKGYLAEAVLGVTTDTDDATGSETARVEPDRWPDHRAVEAALATFAGTTLQRPPDYSAKRVAGRRSHALARAGRPEALAPVPVTVHRMELLGWEPPVARFQVEVSAGTYVRALARDLGARLGLGGHLRALRRLWIGPLRVDDAVPLEQVAPGIPLRQPLDAFPRWPRVHLSPAEASAARHGQPVARDDAAGEAVLVERGRLLAVAEARGAAWQPRVVLEET